ncbi:glycine rich domain-containing protein [Ottowia thiooxydans]|uniref:glycine rich domain-containing protein n=1 Tax=Ottowia thiooxydans TaxID=219182 RepID=UPI003393A1DE
MTFTYTGAVQTFVVPSGVTSLTLEAWGAQGGTRSPAFSANQGGYATGILAVTPGETLQIYVGGRPSDSSAGFNGGGAGDFGGAGGGGASDIRQGGTSLANRVLVAAGGGGGGEFSSLMVVGGVGGGLSGGDGYREPDYSANPGGLGATQTGGGANGTCGSLYVSALAGSLGQGGSPAGLSCAGCQGHGGGGGYYGGAGSGNCRGGGGGSSYFGSLFSGSSTPGVQSGNGEIQITFGGLPQTLTFDSGPVVAVNATNSVNATSASPNSGNAVVYTTTSTGCSVTAAGVVTGIHAGTGNCTILATQAGDDTFAEGTASLTFSIVQSGQTLVFPPQTPASLTFVLGSTFVINPAASNTGLSSGNAITYSSLTTDVCTVSGTTVTMQAAGACILAADQAGNTDFTSAIQATQTVTLSAVPVVPAVTAVPTLSEWVMVLLSLGAAALGVRRLKKD